MALLAITAGCRSHCPLPHLKPSRTDPVPIKEEDPITQEGRSLGVFRIGTGPPVIVLHEVTGLSPETFRLGGVLAQAGFSVYLPLLFGDLGDSRFFVNSLRACTGGWFHCLDRTGSNDPRLVEALLALSRRVSAQNHDAPVGVIGMCLTGNTGLELVRKGSPVRAVVVSQPALPFFKPAALGVSGDTLERVRKQEVPVLAFRFTHDSRSSHERLRHLQTGVGERFVPTEIDSSPRNSFGLTRRAHAVLTTELVEDPHHPTWLALDQVIHLFKDELRKPLPADSTDPTERP